MSTGTWIAVVAVGLYAWYVAIVQRRNRLIEALAGMDVQLQKRHDLIPNVLAIARRFMEHERELLTEITELRARAQRQAGGEDLSHVAERFRAEAALGKRLGTLFALAENYPQLRSDGPMIEAQRTYTEVETNVAAARRTYNAALTELRNAVQIFPGPLLMGFAGVRELPPPFQAHESAGVPLDAAAYLDARRTAS
jgi:LemA protein